MACVVSLTALVVLLGPAVGAARGDASGVSKAVRDDWEFQFRTMGYGPIDTRTEPDRVDGEAAAARPGDRDRVDVELRRIDALLGYWQGREPNEPKWAGLRRQWEVQKAAGQAVPLDPDYLDPNSQGARRKLFLGAESLRRQAYGAKALPRPGPLPHLLRNDETATGMSLDDPPLLDGHAKFQPTDRDQADVVLRRTEALLGYWLAKEPAAAKWQAFARRLAELKTAERATNPDLTGNDAARHKVYLDLCSLRREVVLANPLLDFDDLVFIEHSDVANYLERVRSYGVPRPGGGLHVLRGLKSDSPRVEDLLGKAVAENGDYAGRGLTGGIFQRPEVSFDGRTVYFAWAELKENAKEKGRYLSGPYHIFRIGIDGAGLRQLTFGPAGDMEPCELPNGRIMFTSTRRASGDRCCGCNRTAFFLHSMKPDGGDIICLSFHETHEWEPSVDNNGMVVYSRWDYIDRPPQGPRNMWLCRPDGSDPRAPHGNNGPNSGPIPILNPPIPGYFDSPAHKDWRSAAPLSEVSIRAIPGSHRYMAVAGGHDWNGIGPLILIDLKIPDDYLHSQITRVTPEFYEHDNTVRWNMIWSAPWPLSEDFYLVNRYESIGILDRFGNFEEIHRMTRADAENRAFTHTRHLGCWHGMGTGNKVFPKASEVDGSKMYWRPIYPMPLKARPRPPVLPTRTFQEADRRGRPDRKPATISVMNVYDTDVPLPKGAKVQWMRIVQVLPWGPCPYGNVANVAHYLNRTVIGVVPVEADGSVYCEAPVQRGLYFQLLDGNGAAVHGMQSDTYVHPGEQLSCAGCHEKNSGPPQRPKATPLAMRRAPSRIRPECADLEPTLFQRHIVPIFDGVCTRCHQREKKGPAMVTWGCLRSHPTRKCVTRPGSTRTTPGEFGATSTFTWTHALRHKEAFRGDQLRRLAQWLDLYCPATATGETASAQRQHAGEREWPLHSDFDPLNPMGLEQEGGLGADGTPIPAAWAAALAGEKTDEGRAALLDHLSWRLGTKVFSWGDAEEKVCRMLVPMLADQRERAYRTALRWLRSMANQDQKPAKEQIVGTADAWREHYERKYPGRTLDLAKAVRERIVVVRTGLADATGFEVDGQRVEDVTALERCLAECVKEARDAGRIVTVVVQSPAWASGCVVDGKGFNLAPTREELAVEEAKRAAWGVVGNCTAYPDTYTFRKPYTAGKPAAPPAVAQKPESR
jgi:hypothetical protein